MFKYKQLIYVVLSVCLVWACGKDDNGGSNGKETPARPDGLTQIEQLWFSTSPLDVSDLRMGIFNTLQGYADACTSTAFGYLLASDANKYALTVKYDNILSCYDAAFDRVLSALKSGRPSNGKVVIWLLYNMGYVIQTPDVNFAIDIYHYRAKELEPYLDFLCSTHVHQDHKSEPLMDAMFSAGKPVITNFYEPEKNYAYCSAEAKDYIIKGCSLHTFITRHNNGSINVPVTVFQIDCGEASGNFVLLHSGDSNFIASEYDVTLPVDVYIPRYAQTALDENNVIGNVCTPEYVLMSHILELGHKDVTESRWPFDMALERASGLKCDKTYVPFWGEGLVWSDKKLNIYR